MKIEFCQCSQFTRTERVFGRRQGLKDDGCAPVGVVQRSHGAELEQRLRDGRVASTHSHVQRALSAAVASVLIGAGSTQRLDGGGLVAERGVVNGSVPVSAQNRFGT